MHNNIATQVAEILRARGNKTIKAVFWNKDMGNFSIFLKGGASFNYDPEPEEELEDITDAIERRAQESADAGA